MINTVINETELHFNTNEKVFSPEKIDKGTLAMLHRAGFKENEKILDLGCGYGVVGILAAKTVGEENVFMSDIEKENVTLSKANAKLNGVPNIKMVVSDGFKNIDEAGFDKILSNPPYHTDFSVPKEFIEKGFNRLKIGGKMYMVTKRLNWYKNKLSAIFGSVRVYEENGYYIFVAEKKKPTYANIEKKERKHEAKHNLRKQ